MNCSSTPSAISSPESASGPDLFVLQDGQTIDLYGLGLARVSLSPRLAKALGLTTSGTSGRHGTTSSASAALQSSLENRLRQRLSTLGSTLYTLTWKPWATPSGPSRSRLRASARRTSETAATGWPTPAGRDWKGSTLEGWGTPMASDKIRSEEFAAGRNPNLREGALLAGWPTTTTQDSADSRAYGYRGQTFMTLTDAARSADSGPVLTGSPVETRSGGQLAPSHSRWLMGLPIAWDECAPRSLPKSRKK